MPYRVFVDSTGADWQVWDIVPRLSERRSGEVDRRLEITPISFPDRREEGRRLAYARRSALRGTYAHGWLCFDNDKEKRRLSPIPQDWTTCSDERLEEYARGAERVTGAHRTLTLQDEGPLAEAG